MQMAERKLELAQEGNKETYPDATISEFTWMVIDINGRRERLWAYIIPGLQYNMILGKRWAEDNDVVYKAGKRQLRIGRGHSQVRIREAGWMDAPAVKGRTKEIREAKLVSSSVFAATVKRARWQDKRLHLFSASMEDINKALDKLDAKSRISKEDLIELLPDNMRDIAQHWLPDDDDALPPRRPGWDHTINLEKDSDGNTKTPPYGPLYEMSREELLVLRKTLTHLLDKGWIRASNSSASSPVLFAKKPGGGLRFCVDYRALNSISKMDRYPLPLIRETLRHLAKAKWYTKLDVVAAFHRVRIQDGDEWKTAFRTRYGLYEWLVLPFGLCGGPATFQRIINTILADLLDECCSAYIDDVIIYSSGTKEEHLNKVKEVACRLGNAGLKLDINKCEFAVTEIKYLGFVVKAGEGVTVDPAKVEAIREWETPKCTKEVRSFIGFSNFYREFIDHFATLADPLIKLTRNNTPWQWGEAEQQAFDHLKEYLIAGPLLLMFDETLETLVEADSSGFALGGVVSQVDSKGRLRPIGFFSRKLTATEVNYEIHDKELLAIVATMKHFSGELRSLEQPFTVLSDHKNLSYFMTKRQLTERQVRMAEELSRYDFRLQFRKGVDSALPDFLSRRAQDRMHSGDERLQARHRQLLKDSWMTNQKEEATRTEDGATVLTALLNCLDASPRPPEPVRTQPVFVYHTTMDKDAEPRQPIAGSEIFDEESFARLWDRAISADKTYREAHFAVAIGKEAFPAALELGDVQMPDCSFDKRGALLYRGKIWVPDFEPLRTALIQRTHDHHVTGHPGRDITLAILQRDYFWPQQYLAVKKFLRNCGVCGRSKHWRQKRQGFLRPLPIPDRFHSELSIDFMTELPAKEEDDPRFLMVLTDRLLKSVVLEATKSMEAEECAETFLNCHVRFHGFPHALTSDRGSNWVSRFWARLCELTGVERRLSTAFHPQTDGATERMNQEVLNYLRAFITYAQYDWPRLLPMCMLGLNNRPSSVTKFSPFFMEHGYDIEPIQQKWNQEKSSIDPKIRAENFVSRLKEGEELAAAAMATAQQIMEHKANRDRKAAEVFKVGDTVWLNLRNVTTPQLKKKLSWTQAKYKVTRVLAPDVYQLSVPSSIHNRFFTDLLRKDPADPFPSQLQDDTQPPPIHDGSDPLYAVEKVLRARKHRGRRQVLVKWQGYREPTWQPREDLRLTDAFKEFVRIFGDRDGVGEDEGARTGSTGKMRKKRKRKK